MMIKNGVSILIIVPLIFTGCVDHQIKDTNSIQNSENTTTQPEVDDSISTEILTTTMDVEAENNLRKEKLLSDDLNITYKGIVINDLVDFNDIADNLGIEIGKTDNNCETRAGTFVGNWFVVHYPSLDDEDMELNYVAYQQDNSVKLISVQLYDVETSRGIRIGDGLDKVVNLYGDYVEAHYNSSSSELYQYILDYNNDEPFNNKSIYFIVDNETQKVTDIGIDYNSNKTIDELGISE